MDPMYNKPERLSPNQTRLSNRIEEPDTKIEKDLAKIKIDFFDFFGVGGGGRQCHSFLFYTVVPFF
jgi:hypothetical protein